MGFDWEEVLDAEGDEIADAYDDSASDALYQAPRSSPGVPAFTYRAPSGVEKIPTCAS